MGSRDITERTRAGGENTILKLFLSSWAAGGGNKLQTNFIFDLLSKKVLHSSDDVSDVASEQASVAMVEQ